jgi:hypothetical protein
MVTPGRAALTTRSARRINGDVISGDRIENGHGQPPPVQAYSKRRIPDFDHLVLKLWLQDSYRGGWSLLNRAPCGYHGTALLSNHGHVPVLTAHCRVSAAE